jgi:hypothetical protein
MTSIARLIANRANARKSTGPRTVAGKRRAARNSTRHGFLAGPKTGDIDAMLALILEDHVEPLYPASAADPTIGAALELARAEARLEALRGYERAFLVNGVDNWQYRQGLWSVILVLTDDSWSRREKREYDRFWWYCLRLLSRRRPFEMRLLRRYLVAAEHDRERALGHWIGVRDRRRRGEGLE